jgi:phosphotransferase system enzyme I (PtsI)
MWAGVAVDRSHGVGAQLAASANVMMMEARPHPRPTRLADGQPITLLAAVGDASGLARSRAEGAEGVELLPGFTAHSGHTDAVLAYADVMRSFPGGRVVLESDVGAGLPGDPLADPRLPARRGIRALRGAPGALAAQLDALAAARWDAGAEFPLGVDGVPGLGVVAGMVTDAEDATWFTAAAGRAGIPDAGVVIEVPAAALISAPVLRAASFVTIDLDGLTRHTLAAESWSAEGGFDPWHPAVLRLAELVGASGALAGTRVGARGAGVADPRLACVLVGLGATTVSVAPEALRSVRAELSRQKFVDCLRFAELATRANSGADGRHRVAEAMRP